jgi:DNA-binding NarL/FixJ family response regulator
MTIRVLVVDDHEPWRRLVISELLKKPECEIVGEVDDGLEGVDAAARLAPDLILLDVGLPSITGIEVARRILAIVSGIKILFLSAHMAPPIINATLAAGGHGYVLRSDAGDELLAAIETILQGGQFISPRLVADDR